MVFCHESEGSYRNETICLRHTKQFFVHLSHYIPCGLGFTIESRVERTHPDQSFHKFNAKIFIIMSDEFMVALEPNQGHAYALLKEIEENNSTDKAA